MGILGSTIILFYFVFPGLIFRKFFYYGEVSYKYSPENIPQAILKSLIPSFFITVTYIVMEELVYLPIDYERFFNVFLASSNYENGFSVIRDEFWQIVLFHTILFLYSCTLGFALNKVAIK